MLGVHSNLLQSLPVRHFQLHTSSLLACSLLQLLRVKKLYGFCYCILIFEYFNFRSKIIPPSSLNHPFNLFICVKLKYGFWLSNIFHPSLRRWYLYIFASLLHTSGKIEYRLSRTFSCAWATCFTPIWAEKWEGSKVLIITYREVWIHVFYGQIKSSMYS